MFFVLFCVVFRFVFVGFGGPGVGFGGFPVGSKSSGKATTTTTKKNAAQTTTRSTQTNKNKTKSNNDNYANTPFSSSPVPHWVAYLALLMTFKGVGTLKI